VSQANGLAGPIMAHWLFLPDDAYEDLVILSRLSSEQIESLRKHLDSNEFQPRYAFFVKVAELLGVSDETAAKLCTFVNHVHNQRRKLNRDADSVPEEFESFLRRSAPTGKQAEELKRLTEYLKKNRQLLVRLFSDLSERERSGKVQELELGPLPHLHSVRTFCDVRPVYDESAGKIVANIPILTLQLVTHSTETDEYTQVLIQLTENNLTEFRKAFERIDKKLALLKAEHELAHDKK
jgi:hypothetical protein